MLVETVQYYDENGRQPVYVLQLDASKAFDRVSYYIIVDYSMLLVSG